VSRRLTTAFGWPVDPDDQEVFLTDSGSIDLPLELTVDIGNTEGQAWDLVWVQPARSGYDNLAINTFKLMAGDIYNTLAAKNLAWSMMKYGWGTQIDFVTTLGGGRPTLATFTDTLTALSNSLYTGTGTVGAQIYCLSRIADPAVNMGWHSFAKRLVLVLADTAYDTTFDFTTLRVNLLKQNIIPVFAVPASLMATYQGLVDNTLGFGLVVELSANSENIVGVINKALTRVVGNVFLLFSGTGYVDPAYDRETMNIWGLSSGMRARFVVPVTPELPDVIKQETILVPGYGIATVENVISDKPWTTGSKQLITTEDYTVAIWGVDGYMIYVAGSAYKNIPSKVKVYLTQGTIQGSIFEFSEAEGLGDEIFVDPDTPYLITEPLGRIIYQPNSNVYSPNNQPTDWLYYKVNDLCQDSPDSVIPIVILGVNDPPVPSCPKPVGDEDTPILIQLSGYDVENDPFKFSIVKLPLETTADGSEAGKLYQWADNVANAELIDTVPTNLTDPLGRMIYVPPLNANSDGLPPLLKINPSFSFRIEETSCCTDYVDSVRVSVNMDIPIRVNPVNDPPTIWADPEGKRVVLADEPAICFMHCTYLEDFGHPQGFIYSPAQIFVGGHDIELSDLTIIVTDLQCPTGALTTLDGQNVVVGTNVPGVQVDALKAAFLFKPLPDENGNNYCVITYKVNDGELDSLKTWTITIDITPVNDLPRLIQKEITTYENKAKTFSIDANDIDSNHIQATFVACVGSGVLTYNGQDVCTDVSKAPILAVDAATATWALTYTPPDHKSGLQMLTVELELNDNDPSNPSPLPASDHYFLIINVLAINDGPVIAEFKNGSATIPEMVTYLPLTLSVKPKTDAAIPLLVDDIDVAANLLKITATTNCGLIQFTLTDDVKAQLQGWQETQILTPYSYTVEFQLPLAMLQKLLKTITFTSDTECTANVVLIVNDQGYVGQCPPNADGTEGPHYCPLQAVLNATVIVAKPNSTPTAVIGGVTAGGAALGLVAAAVLFKLFRTPKAGADYQPWNMDKDSDSTTENPLYKPQENQGQNPMYNMTGTST
jgi:hypothetical protein